MSKMNKFFALFLALVMVCTVSFSAMAETAAEAPAAPLEDPVVTPGEDPVVIPSEAEESPADEETSE